MLTPGAVYSKSPQLRVGKHNINSYAVKVNGSNQVTIRNRATLRKIPKPVPIHIPVIESDLSRPAMEPRSAPLAPSRVTRSMGQGDTVSAPLAPSRVTRSMGQGDTVSRQSTMNTLVPPAQSRVARPEVQGSMGSRQGLMKKGPNQTSQAFYGDVCDNMMEQIADTIKYLPGWDIGHGIVGQKSEIGRSFPNVGQMKGPVEVRIRCSCKGNSICCPFWLTVKKRWPKTCSGFHVKPKFKCPNRG